MKKSKPPDQISNELSELYIRSTEIQAILENNLYDKEDEQLLVLERNYIDDLIASHEKNKKGK